MVKKASTQKRASATDTFKAETRAKAQGVTRAEERARVAQALESVAAVPENARAAYSMSISIRQRAVIKALADLRGSSVQAVIRSAIEQYINGVRAG